MDIQTKIENYSAILLKKYDAEIIKLNEKNNIGLIKIPIKMIDRVKVFVRLIVRLSNSSLVILEITVNDIYENDNFEDITLHRKLFHINNKDFTEVAKFILVELNELRLDMKGKLTNKKNMDDELLEHELLSGLDNIELYADECCVCNNLTQTKTKCNHCVCYRCMTHIKPVNNDDEDEDSCEIPCPICRQDIRFEE
jgi:hypothetical protein